jgi:hypothetical protein
VTALDFHPTRNNLLLSGGDDGAVCVFDTEVAEEEDSLLQAFNHGPIHKAGFLGTADLYALSSDQNLALHPLTVDDVDADTDQTPAPKQLGDLRPSIPCEYVIDVLQSGPDHVVAAGSHRYVWMNLVSSNSRLTIRKPLACGFGQDRARSRTRSRPADYPRWCTRRGGCPVCICRR